MVLKVWQRSLKTGSEYEPLYRFLAIPKQTSEPTLTNEPKTDLLLVDAESQTKQETIKSVDKETQTDEGISTNLSIPKEESLHKISSAQGSEATVVKKDPEEFEKETAVPKVDVVFLGNRRSVITHPEEIQTTPGTLSSDLENKKIEPIHQSPTGIIMFSANAQIKFLFQ